ncbi:MAG: UDP-N-acetylglucosamine 2-epimerase [Bacteroidales bacterium]
MKIAILTSSRADFSLYLPLLKALKADPFFQLRIIAYGSHLSPEYGMGINHITEAGFDVAYQIPGMPLDDSPFSISKSMGRTMIDFAEVWKNESFDLVFALGDRFEMFAAVASGIPFNVKFAHIHGGETTEGAIDDAFRHSITQMSLIHFACTETYRLRVSELKGSGANTYNTGALGIDNLRTIQFLSINEFKTLYEIDLSIPTILTTVHPETILFGNNAHHIDELIAAFDGLQDFQVVITMPNADTTGLIIREKLKVYAEGKQRIKLVENFGSLGYLSCMKYCRLMLGNTSSGFFEASFFPKWVINLGTRQKGRILTPNIISCPFETNEIIESVNSVKQSEDPGIIDIYGRGTAAENIVKILKHEYR